MKTFYLKQKVFSLTDRYKVYDGGQNVVFHCEGKLFSFTHRMDFFDSAKNDILFTIKKQVLSLLPIYHLTAPDGREVATVRKRFTVLKQKLDIESRYGDYTIEGDFFAHEFQISSSAGTVVEFRKKWISWGDSYEIAVLAEENVAFFVALVVMIDDCLHDNEGKSGATIHIGGSR